MEKDVEASATSLTKQDSHEIRKLLMAILAYLLIGALFYDKLEGWNLRESVYYSLAVITTVGYGDFHPKTSEGKVFTIVYAAFGIGVIGIVLGNLADAFIARQQALAKESSKQLLQSTQTAASLAATAKLQSTAPAGQVIHHKAVDTPSSETPVNNPSVMRSVCMPIGLSLAGGVVMGWIEGWNFVDSIYTSVITITTIGFGDMSPQSAVGQWYAIAFLPMAVIAVANAIANMVEIVSRSKLQMKKVSMQELIEMDTDGDRKVSELEFLCYMLVKLEKVDEEELEEIRRQFHQLDVDGSKELDQEDLKRFDEYLGK